MEYNNIDISTATKSYDEKKKLSFRNGTIKVDLLFVQFILVQTVFVQLVIVQRCFRPSLDLFNAQPWICPIYFRPNLDLSNVQPWICLIYFRPRPIYVHSVAFVQKKT